MPIPAPKAPRPTYMKLSIISLEALRPPEPKVLIMPPQMMAKTGREAPIAAAQMVPTIMRMI